VRTSTLRLSTSAGAARRARAHVTSLCNEWHAEEVADPAALVTSELVTNALLHGDGDPELVVQLTPDVLMISVGDASQRGTTASALPPSPIREHGRGLLLVDAVTDSWGVVPDDRGGKVIWAALRRRVTA
jgi:anti-sigma regulatory factor (Ser/Thr protein kinase)